MEKFRNQHKFFLTKSPLKAMLNKQPNYKIATKTTEKYSNRKKKGKSLCDSKRFKEEY
jgi:hypothetical protein